MIWAAYSLLALAVMLPLLMPGYILTLDLVFTPQLGWPAELSNSYLFEALLHILNIAVSAQVIEKILLLAILVLSGVGAHKLVLGSMNIDKKYLYWGAYFAGIFYMINPFVYSRFMAGQHLVLLGYALTPFFVLALLKFIKEPGWRTSLVLAGWASLIVGISLHHAGILLLLGLGLLLAMVWHYRKRQVQLKKLAVFGMASLAAVLLINAYWFVPTLLGNTSIGMATSGFGNNEYQAFATTGQSVLGALGNVVRLQGFWVEAREMFVLPQTIIPAWGLLMFAVWLSVNVGVLKIWRINKPLVVGLCGAGLAAIILAITPLVEWLAPYIPFVSGYREPQKFIAILALVYAMFGAVGVSVLLERLSKKYDGLTLSAALGVALILPIICTPTMLWGFGGQLSPKQYPADWHAVNEQLNNDQSASKVLFLPWHQYINFGFSERIIANPAPKFFNKPTVAGDNPEYKGVAPTVPSAFNRRIEQEVLAMGDTATHLGSQLANLGFSHVILAKEYDYQHYDYLDSQSDLTLVSDTENLKLYAVTKGGSDEN